MSWLSRLLNVVRPDRVRRDLDDELEFHAAARADELTREGLSADRARSHADRRLGNRLALRDESRDIKLLPWLESILLDVGFGLRLCRKNATVTAAAVISLSLAIGACTAAFSLVDALILRPLPVKDPHELIHLAVRVPGDDRDGLSFNYPLFERLRKASRSQVRLFGMSDQRRGEAVFDNSSGQIEQVYGQWISGDAFELLGVKPALGRLLAPTDDLKPGQHPVAVLSHQFWVRRFARDPNVLGRWVTIREKQLQIVGVAEEGFTGVEPGIRTDLWAPNMMWAGEAIFDSGYRWFRVWGRLQPGVASADRPRAILQTEFTNFQREDVGAFPADEPRERIERLLNTRIHLRSAAHGPSGLREDFERPLWILAVIAGLVLLVACSNVASLLIARAATRTHEMSLRISIGAGRGRLVQQVLIESAILALSSCVLGVLIAYVAAPWFVSLLSTARSTVYLDLPFDGRLVGFLGAIGAGVTLLFGLAPAVHTSAAAPVDALKSTSGRHTASIGLFRPLVAAQTAFSFVVLFVAGLFLASFTKLVRSDLGFDPENLAIVSIDAKDLRQNPEKAFSAWEQLQEHLRRTPGIQSASLSGWGLFEGRGRNKGVRIPGRAADAYRPWYLPVSPRFLENMGIRLIDGRDFDWRDANLQTPSAVIVNESFARRYFPGESALGKRFSRVDGNVLAPQEIIGIAADAKYTSVRGEAPPTVYDPLRPEDSATLQIRTRLAPESLAALLRQELPRVHPAFRMTQITPQSTFVDNSLRRDRVLALLSGYFSFVAVVLLAVGLFGVLSYGVVQRTREIGIRLALGARPLQVVGLVLSEIGLVMALGLGLGLAGGMAASRYVETLLYDVKPDGMATIAAPLACLLAACALSALVPALRAVRVDPVTALRGE